MLLLLAQLVAPPVQPGPVRLPGAGIERPAASPLPLEPNPAPVGGPEPSTGPPTSSLPVPTVVGVQPYGPGRLRQILEPCLAVAAPDRLEACAQRLAGQLLNDGYINSRVYALPGPAAGTLEVVEGRLAEVRVECVQPRLQRRLQRLVQPLQGKVLHLPSLQASLSLLQRQPGVGRLSLALNRLGGDSSQGVLVIQAEPGGQPLHGELTLRNDGTAGSGQFRGLATLLQPDLLLPGDSLLLFTELNADENPSLGALNGSLSYTLPLSDSLRLSTAFAASSRRYVEVAAPFDSLRFRQLQGLGQLEFTLAETLNWRWFGFAGLSLNRNDAFLEGRSFPAILGGADSGWLRTGFLRSGLGGEGVTGRLAWSGSLYGLQGVAGLTNAAQREELASFGIAPGRARALGGQVSGLYGLAPRWQVQVQLAAQWALAPLPNPMGFSLGSDNGLRGLPGQVVSGDSGLLGSVELGYTAWQQGAQRLQLVPFVGAGGVRTDLPGVALQRTSVGAGGLLVRLWQGRHWQLELGWVRQFGSDGRPAWQDWLLSSGLYTKLDYRF